MILGIDPKNDYAFKCVFGSPKHTGVLIHLLNAVLRPEPNQRIVAVEILNPISEPVVLDEKLAILDIKARDQSGRQFDIEMQMVVHPSLRSRFLYYWSKMYSSQLVAGDEYERLRPAISICFVDGLLIPDTDDYQLHFQLCCLERQIVYSDHLHIHLFQLPNFTKSVDELADPVDLWLYLLNNGEKLDPDHLPEALEVPEVREAVGVLSMLTQEELERERYEARERARRDAISWQKMMERLQREAMEAEQRVAEMQQQAAQAQQQAAQAQQQAAQAQQQAAQAEREKEEAKSRLQKELMNELIAKINLCEQLLQQTPTPEDVLSQLPLEELKEKAKHLQARVLEKN